MRLTLGFGFIMLGWLKIYNHDLVAGVADQFPSAMEDPMVKMFSLGTDPYYRRECWIVSFGLAEVMSGFMLMSGCFTRVWGVIMTFVFTKLMLVDFGWNEIPHLFPIGALAVVALSNKLTCELDPIERMEETAGRDGRTARQIAIIGGASIAIAFLVIFPLLFALTFSDRTNL